MKDTIQVHPVPFAAFDTVMNTPGYAGNGAVSFINRSQNAGTYLWNFGDGTYSNETDPSHIYQHMDTFSAMLIAYSNYGCSDTAFMAFFVLQKALYVPNALQPGYQGNEDLVKVWKPLGIGLFSYHAQVFDKWGELMWESDKLSETQPVEWWDGTYRVRPVSRTCTFGKLMRCF